MANITVPYPATDKAIQLGGFERSHLGDLLYPVAFGYNVTEDAFTGDSLRAEYGTGITNGTSAALTLDGTQANGGLSLVTGTDDNGYAGQGYALQWTGDRGFLYESFFTTPSAVTTLKLENGVTDALSDAGAVDVKATPTGTATDFAVFVVDTDDDANIAFVSSKGGTLVATQDIKAVAVSTTYHVAIRVDGDNVEGYLAVAGQPLEKVAAHMNSAGIEGGNAVAPWAFAQARTGSASRTVIWRKWRMISPAF